jgi:tetratricopeptide (TPR) repeat protein
MPCSTFPLRVALLDAEERGAGNIGDGVRSMSATASIPPVPPPQPAEQRGAVLRWMSRASVPFRSLAARIRCRPRQACAALVLLLFIGAVGTIAGRQVWAEYHFRAARRCLAENKLIDAQGHLEKAFQIRADAPTHLLAARLARRMNDGPAAQAHISECDRILGGISPECEFERELIQAQMGDFQSVERSLQGRLDHNDPETPTILEAMAEGHWNYNQLHAALGCLDKWLELQPANIRAHYLRGEVQVALHHFEEAAADYQVCLESDPGSSDIRFKLAKALLRRRNPEQALPHFQVLQEQSPGNVLSSYYIARCQIGLGHTDEAKRLLDALIAAHPGFAGGWRDRGEIAFNAEDYGAAERDLRKAIELLPGDFQAHYILHLCLIAEGKDPSVERAAFREIQRDSDRIREIRDNILPLQPRNPHLHYELGILHLQMEMKEEGVRWLESALLLAPNLTEAKDALAKCKESAKKVEYAKPAPTPP